MAPPTGKRAGGIPPKRLGKNTPKTYFDVFKETINRENLNKVIFQPNYSWILATLLFIAEVFVNVIVIERVPYTEIDWKTYMQQAEGFLNGTWDYTELKGDTGPLVYPAGFLYIFSGLYYVTKKGWDLYLAQYIFAFLYMLTLSLVFRIYVKSKKLPPYSLIFLCCTSYRVHSIYILRLFNDPIAMIFFYLAVNLFLEDKWTSGSVCYSLAVSVKMNILLTAPALFFAYLRVLGIQQTVLQLSVCAAIQLILGLPFLWTNPIGYVSRAFNLGRVFLFEWTVNWRFLPEDVFVHPAFHLALLVLHVLVLIAFFMRLFDRCLKSYPLFCGKLDQASGLLLLPLFGCNFIGMVFARSLHYQFYVWYFHTLPYLLWTTPFSFTTRAMLLGMIELCWNTFPSTYWSSALLHLSHFTILYGLWKQIPNTPKSE